jgi:hypothetical protein
MGDTVAWALPSPLAPGKGRCSSIGIRNAAGKRRGRRRPAREHLGAGSRARGGRAIAPRSYAQNSHTTGTAARESAPTKLRSPPTAPLPSRSPPRCGPPGARVVRRGRETRTRRPARAAAARSRAAGASVPGALCVPPRRAASAALPPRRAPRSPQDGQVGVLRRGGAGPGPHAGLSGSVLQGAARPRSAALRPPSARPAGPSCRPPAHLPNSSNSCPWDVALCVSAALARVLPAEAAAAGGTFAGVLRAAHAAIASGDSAAAQAAREEFFKLVRARVRAAPLSRLLSPAHARLLRRCAEPARGCSAHQHLAPLSSPPPAQGKVVLHLEPGKKLDAWRLVEPLVRSRVGGGRRGADPDARRFHPHPSNTPFPHARARHARRSASCALAWTSWS